MNGPPTEREHADLVARVARLEQEIVALREFRARAHGVASVLGFLGGVVAASIITAVLRAIGSGP